jgi:Thiolase, N-terminal domain
VLATLSAAELATMTLRGLVDRTGLGEGDVDDVILGNGYANGEAPAIGRIAALDAGLGVGVPGLQIDRRCGSGLRAVLYAAGQVATGAARVVVAGGAESMSNVEHYALGLHAVHQCARVGNLMPSGTADVRRRSCRGRSDSGCGATGAGIDTTSRICLASLKSNEHVINVRSAGIATTERSANERPSRTLVTAYSNGAVGAPWRTKYAWIELATHSVPTVSAAARSACASSWPPNTRCSKLSGGCPTNVSVPSALNARRLVRGSALTIPQTDESSPSSASSSTTSGRVAASLESRITRIYRV